MHESSFRVRKMAVAVAVLLFILLQGIVYICNVCYYAMCLVIDSV